MKALVVVAHGSRRVASNKEVIEFANELGCLMADEYPIVEAGFLEIAEPQIPDCLETIIARGSTEISVFPYFLSAGRHVVTDVPNEVKTIQDKYPHIQVTILSHLGNLPGLSGFIASTLQG